LRTQISCLCPPEKFNVRISGQFGMQYYAEEIAEIIKPKPKLSPYFA